MSDATNQALKTLTDMLASALTQKPEVQDLSKLVPDISQALKPVELPKRHPCPMCGGFHG